MSQKERFLLVEDDDMMSMAIGEFLKCEGYEVQGVKSCSAARQLFPKFNPDVVILDYLLDDGDSLDLLPHLKKIGPQVPIIFMTAHGSIDLAARATKLGAEKFITKPLDFPALNHTLKNLLETQDQRRGPLSTEARYDQKYLDPFLGSSPAIANLERIVRKIVGTGHPILITGESGTGKGVLCNWIHQNSWRASQTLVDINCAGLSKELLESELFGYVPGAFTGATKPKPGLLEIATKGTLFLDEIGEMDLRIQPKLLKVLEQKTLRRLGDTRERFVDMQLIAATNRDLVVEVREKRFREDLFYRINTLPIRLPPLRERMEDLPQFSQSILYRICKRSQRMDLEFDPAAMKAMVNYSWPGNFRELNNVLERAVLLAEGTKIGVEHIQFNFENEPLKATDTSRTLQEMENHYIQKILKEENGNVPQAALRLDIPRSSLYQKLKKMKEKV